MIEQVGRWRNERGSVLEFVIIVLIYYMQHLKVIGKKLYHLDMIMVENLAKLTSLVSRISTETFSPSFS